MIEYVRHPANGASTVDTGWQAEAHHGSLRSTLAVFRFC